MRGLVNMYHHSYTFFSFLIVFVLLLFRPTISSERTIVSLSPTGILELSTMDPTSMRRKVIWSAPNDECDMYDRCGPNSYCNINTSPVCNCIKGFDPKDPQEWRLSNWTSGCVRRMRLGCKKDGFVKLKKMKLPVVDDVIVHKRISTKECKEKCFGDCNCTAFANPVIGNLGSNCVIWTGELMDIRIYADQGQDLYVRLAASELG